MIPPNGGRHAQRRGLAPQRDDVPGVRDLGLVAAPALPLPHALPAPQRGRDRLDLRHPGHRVGHGAVRERPDRRPLPADRPLPGPEPPRGRPVHVGPRVPAHVLVVLPHHARPLAGLRADALPDQLDLLPSPEGRPEGVRPRPPVGHHRVDRGELALRLHPQGEGGRGHGRARSAASSWSPASPPWPSPRSRSRCRRRRPRRRSRRKRDLCRHPAPRGAEHPRAVRGDLPRCRRAPVLFLLDRSLPLRHRPSREHDHARDEHRADLRDRDHGRRSGTS